MAKLLRILATPFLLFYLLPWLMLLLVIGTIAQRYIGLFASEKLFFSAYIFWLGPVPLPGVYTVLALMAMNLMAKLLFKSPWKKEHAGIIITHVSVIVLLLGGLITAFFRQEAYMVLGPGETNRIASDYHQRELAIIVNGMTALAIPYEQLSIGKVIGNRELPFTLRIEKLCRNCSAIARKSDSTLLRGMAQQIDITPAPLNKEEEENQPGVAFALSSTEQELNGTYIAFPLLREQPAMTLGKDHYTIVMRNAERTLPFSLTLMKFKRTTHPGTDIAASYRSLVKVKDGALAWNADIEMNTPLHYKGYTVYQSSYVEEGGREMTVLAVVKNIGQIFPYIALGTLCLGLLVHLAIVMPPARFTVSQATVTPRFPDSAQ